MTESAFTDYQTLLRADFCAFVMRCFLELNAGAEPMTNWHIELIADALERCRTGEIRRLIINLPPRHLKSLMASIAFAAWLLGHDPAAQIINITYGQELSDKLAEDCRKIMRSGWFKSLFGEQLSGRTAVHDFSTPAGGFRLATSIGGALTGRGADFIIIDDPLKADEAASDAARDEVNHWFDSTVLSRLNNQRTGVIIVIMQRLHENDLAGHLLARGGWELLSLPAISTRDEVHEIHTPNGRRRFTRSVGDVLHPERMPLETLQELRRSMGESNFAAQYQQAPLPAVGVVDPKWFKVYTARSKPDPFDEIVQSWDTANKTTQTANYSVCTTWGIKDGRTYLLDVFRDKLDYAALKRAVIEQRDRYSVRTLLIEDHASGTQLIQDLAGERFFATPCTSQGDKAVRMQAQIGFIEGGMVHIPDQAPWLAAYLEEMRAFPRGRYDDQVDSTAQFLAWFKNRPKGGWTAADWDALSDPFGTNRKKKMVRVKVKAGISHTITISGQTHMTRGDGTIEISESDARALRKSGYEILED